MNRHDLFYMCPFSEQKMHKYDNKAKILLNVQLLSYIIKWNILNKIS